MKMIRVYACVKGHLEPAHLKSLPLLTFLANSLGQDASSIHLFKKGFKTHHSENKVGWISTKLINLFCVKIHFQINKIIKK